VLNHRTVHAPNLAQKELFLRSVAPADAAEWT